MQAVGLKTHIWNNNLKSLLLLAGFPVLLVGMVYALELWLMAFGMLPSTGTLGGDLALALQGLAAGVPIALLASVLWFCVAYLGYQKIIDLSTGAKKVERKDYPELYNMLENLSISRGMRTPTLRIIEDDALNAYATGLHEGQYSVTVTRGLINQLTKAELEAVLAHEMTHVINRDVRLMVIASIFVGIITLLAEVMFRSLRYMGTGRGKRSNSKGAGLVILVALVIAAVGYLLAIVIKMTISRKREFLADAGSVELTKDPDAMISALLKISGKSEIKAPESMRSMLLDRHEKGVMGLFASHPPISKRVDALVKFAGGRLPELQEEAPAPTEGTEARPIAEAPADPHDMGGWENPKLDEGAAAGRGPWSN